MLFAKINFNRPVERKKDVVDVDVLLNKKTPQSDGENIIIIGVILVGLKLNNSNGFAKSIEKKD